MFSDYNIFTNNRCDILVADTFIPAYYDALNESRKTIDEFYVPTSTITTERGLPSITINGTQLFDAAEFKKIFEDQMPFTFYDAQTIDVQILNDSIVPLEPSTPGKAVSKRDLEQNMSLLVQVSGVVRLVERKEGPIRGFSDSFVMVPNRGVVGAKGKPKTGEGRNWAIQTQVSRFVV